MAYGRQGSQWLAKLRRIFGNLWNAAVDRWAGWCAGRCAECCDVSGVLWHRCWTFAQAAAGRWFPDPRASDAEVRPRRRWAGQPARARRCAFKCGSESFSARARAVRSQARRRWRWCHQQGGAHSRIPTSRWPAQRGRAASTRVVRTDP